MELRKKEPGGLATALKHFLQESMPRGVGWPQTLGSSLLALILLQVFTGILLSLYYSPNAGVAYESVRFIEEQVAFGRVIRGLHYFAASAIVLLLFLHILQTFFTGSYKPPRQWTWIFGVVLLLLSLAFAFTGYLLPWDMKAYFATRVGINIGGITPLVGRTIVQILQGGSEMSTLTLARFFSLHVIVLPLFLVIFVGLHLYYLRTFGPTPPGLRNDESITYTHRFYPLQLFRDSVVTAMVIGCVLILAIKFGAPLGPKADPNNTTYAPRPDWYFYGMFQMLKLFPGQLEIVGALVIPGLFVTSLLLLPFLDKNPERRLSRRPLALAAGSSAALVILLLTAWGAYDGRRVNAVNEASAILISDDVRPENGDVANGAKLFSELKCGRCHEQASQGENIPPGLEFSGNKYQQAWLQAYLLKPYRIRWLSKDQRPVARMPNFELAQKEARDLSTYLIQKKIDSKFSETDFDWAQVDSEQVTDGAELAFEYGCYGCHRIGDEGQNIAPALTRVGAKLQEAYLYNLIKDPAKIIPGTAMKNFHLESDEIEDLVAFLRQLR